MIVPPLTLSHSLTHTQVQIGSSSSVWYGAVIRGDVNTIDIGENVTVGDRAMIHCSGIGANKPTKIGNNVVIGAGAIVHGCTLQDECYVGQGAQILDGATVSKNAMVSAGSVLGQGKVVPSGQLWSGIPAIYKRDLTQAEIASISAQAKDNVEWALLHAKESSKNWETIESECEDYEQTINRNESYYKRLSAEAIAFKLGELDNNNAVPGRVLDSGVSARIDPDPRPRA